MIIDKLKKRSSEEDKEPKSKADIPVGKWVKCDKCGEILYKEKLHENFSVCPLCNYHFRLSARRRIWQITDENTFEPFKELNIKTVNPLEMNEYMDKLKVLKEKTGIDEAVVCGRGKINGEEVILCIMDGNFLMGSMGTVVGEKITYSIEKAIELKLPIIIFSVSGGARMQEGILSLMQMAKISSALARHSENGLLYITVLTDPTTGGVTASFAMLGDIIIAEPKTLIGFAGRRVIEGTIKEKLPIDFQSAEFLLEKGFIDNIVDRSELKNKLSLLLKLHKPQYGGENFE